MDNDPRIPALQLLLGDADAGELRLLLATAFGDKVYLLTPIKKGAIIDDLHLGAAAIDRATQMVTEPPLGRIACIQLRRELTDALSYQNRALVRIDNPKR